jgi:hypothetical protein
MPCRREAYDVCWLKGVPGPYRISSPQAAVIVGSGLLGLALPPVDRMTDALRVPIHAHLLDDEVLFDCDLSARRAPAGQANKST